MERMLINKSFDSFTKAVKSLHGEFSATPEKIVKEMFFKLDSIDWRNPNLKILDPAAGFGTFLREAYIRLKEFHSEDHILDNMLYACEINKFKSLFMSKKMGLRNIYVGDFLNMRFPENWPKEFDITVSNPPFGTRTDKKDLKFIEKCYSLTSDLMVFIHPASSYIDLKGNNKTYKNYLENHIEGIEEIVLLNGNFVFDINTSTPCCSITKFNKKKKEDSILVKNKIFNREDKIKSFDELTVWGSRKEFFTFGEKIKKYIESSGSLHSEGNVLGSRAVPLIKNPNSYFVEFTPIRGNISGEENSIHKNDFFTIVRSDVEVKHGVPVNFLIWFEFIEEEDSNRFIKYLKTDFARMCLALSKTNTTLFNGELKTIPWMDFSQDWTDEKLYAHFQISEEEQSFIKEIILPYYD